MKANSQMKGRGASRVNVQQVSFELKHKVILALNKLADRDTYQIGVEELDKLAECLTSEKIAPFVSCILDTDSEQKSAVRKECVRLMGTLAKFHQALIGPHVNKMVASIVKRLKDSDSVVRDACVETMGVLASKLSNHGDESDDGVFVALVRPVFEALGEQNKQPVASTINTLANSVYQVFSASSDEAREIMRQASVDYLGLGGIYTSGAMALLSGLNPRPSSLIFHFLAMAVFGVGRLLLPFPSPKRLWIGAKLIWGASEILFPIIKAEGVRQMFFPATVPALYRAPPVY
ncbi:hypothetical protein KPL71_002450 [Citrus sinensis]|uniref:Uncharacterized protein n=1 Tax=Citrus sinensis TaxID=2711 RepID=A0ACB8P547_CITSI|nr:hypothetical protein KPL71_002450 [Citrus sinensis]